MKFKTKLFSSVMLTFLLVFANCKSEINTGSDINGIIFANYIGNLVKSATSGNCAISINLGSLYTGAIIQGAAASATNFTQAQYEAVTGSTITAQAYATYASVPFNKKYDAFLRTGGVWTETTRNTSLATQKVSTDLAALTGAVVFFCSANLATTPALAAAGATTSATLQGVANAAFATFSTAEQTALNAAINASFSAATGGIVTSWAAYVASANAGVGLASGSNASCLNIATGTAASLNSVINGVSTSAGGIANQISAFASRTSYRSGVALLGCARIPRASCSFAAIATDSLASDISSATATVNSINGNSDCRKPSQGTMNTITNQVFVGASKETVVALNGRANYQNDSTFGGSEGSLTNFQNNKILASSAYPKVGALQNLGQAFTGTFPMREGNTAYNVTAGTVLPTSQTVFTDAPASAAGTIPFYGGSNINVRVVDSCEALGLGAVGPTPLKQGTEVNVVTTPAQTQGQANATVTAALATRRVLTGVAEVVYAFSANGTAAGEYATFNGATYATPVNASNQATTGLSNLSAVVTTTGLNDSITCNRSFRRRTPISAALGVGTTLPDLTVPSGDGAATSLLTACVYGGTPGATGTRAAVAGIFAASLYQLAECPVAAQAGASTFGEFGLQSFDATLGFPNGRQ